MKKKDVIEKYGIEEYKRRLEQHREYLKRTNYNQEYDKTHTDSVKRKAKKYAQTHKDEIRAYNKTVKGRAVKLVNQYNQTDKKMGRYEENITSDYLVDVLFPKGCIYCGEKDPMLLGADRINNDRGHSIDNCVCCCSRCNKERHRKDFQDFFNQKFMETILE